MLPDYLTENFYQVALLTLLGNILMNQIPEFNTLATYMCHVGVAELLVQFLGQASPFHFLGDNLVNSELHHIISRCAINVRNSISRVGKQLIQLDPLS